MKLTKKLISLLLLIGLSGQFAFGQDSFEGASSKAQSDLEASLTELADVRQSIADEKIPLLNKVTTLEDDVRLNQRKVDRLLRLRDNNDMGLNRLRDQVKGLKEQNEYAASLLDEFVRTFETRID